MGCLYDEFSAPFAEGRMQKHVGKGVRKKRMEKESSWQRGLRRRGYMCLYLLHVGRGAVQNNTKIIRKKTWICSTHATGLE